MAKKTSRSAGASSAAPHATYVIHGRRAAVYAFAFSGMAALIYEVVWTRELSLVFGSTVYAVSMMLAAFMSGLSLGAVLGGKWADRTKEPVALFGALEFGVGIFGLLTIPLVQFLPTIYFFVYDALRPGFGLFFVIQLLLSFIIMLIPTTFMGATFPVVSKINTAAVAEVGRDVGQAYSINTLGSIVGSLGAGFLLIPLIGVKATTVTAAVVNVLVALTMIWIAKPSWLRKWLPAGAAIIVAAAGIGIMTPQSVVAHNFYRIGDFKTYADYVKYKQSVTPVFQKQDVHGDVVVLKDKEGALSLQNSGKVEGSNRPLDQQTTSLLAWLPIYTHGDPVNRVLVIGLGTGLTTRAALATDATAVDTVEINKAVIEASHLFVGDDVTGDARSTVYENDARQFLYTGKQRYDVVTSEPSYPLSTHVSHLFTREFYQLVKARMTEDGVFCQWIPRYLLRDQDTEMMLKTFTQVFPNTYVWGSNYGSDEAVDLLMIGINGDAKPDTAAVAARVKASGVTGFDFSMFGGPADIANLVGGSGAAATAIPINTDDRPLLEFLTPRNQIEAYRSGTRSIKAGK